MCQKRRGPSYSPPVRKVYFVGYSDCSKAYRVYIPGQRHIEVNRDVIFHEEVVLHKTLELSTEDTVSTLEFPDSEIQREEEEFEDQIPDAPEDTESPPEELLEVPPSKRRTSSYRETVQEGEKHKAPPGNFRESIRPQVTGVLRSYEPAHQC